MRRFLILLIITFVLAIAVSYQACGKYALMAKSTRLSSSSGSGSDPGLGGGSVTFKTFQQYFPICAQAHQEFHDLEFAPIGWTLGPFDLNYGVDGNLGPSILMSMEYLLLRQPTFDSTEIGIHYYRHFLADNIYELKTVFDSPQYPGPNQYQTVQEQLTVTLEGYQLQILLDGKLVTEDKMTSNCSHIEHKAYFRYQTAIWYWWNLDYAQGSSGGGIFKFAGEVRQADPIHAFTMNYNLDNGTHSGNDKVEALSDGTVLSETKYSSTRRPRAAGATCDTWDRSVQSCTYSPTNTGCAAPSSDNVCF